MTSQTATLFYKSFLLRKSLANWSKFARDAKAERAHAMLAEAEAAAHIAAADDEEEPPAFPELSQPLSGVYVQGTDTDTDNTHTRPLHGDGGMSVICTARCVVSCVVACGVSCWTCAGWDCVCVL